MTYFPMFGPNFQVSMKTTSVCTTFHYLMGHTYSVVKMQVFTELYFYCQYYNQHLNVCSVLPITDYTVLFRSALVIKKETFANF